MALVLGVNENTPLFKFTESQIINVCPLPSIVTFEAVIDGICVVPSVSETEAFLRNLSVAVLVLFTASIADFNVAYFVLLTSYASL